MMEPPHPVPLQDAASTPIGGSGRTPGGTATELLVCVALPFVVPAILLALFRIRVGAPFQGTLPLTDLAFGFGAVAIASMVRSISMRADQWQSLIYIALLVLLIQITVGLAADSAAD